MGPHQKTIATILSAIAFIAILIVVPGLAFVVWIGFFVFMGVGACACLYMMIFYAFQDGEKYKARTAEEPLGIVYDY